MSGIFGISQNMYNRIKAQSQGRTLESSMHFKACRQEIPLKGNYSSSSDSSSSLSAFWSHSRKGSAAWRTLRLTDRST